MQNQLFEEKKNTIPSQTWQFHSERQRIVATLRVGADLWSSWLLRDLDLMDLSAPTTNPLFDVKENIENYPGKFFNLS